MRTFAELERSLQPGPRAGPDGRAAMLGLVECAKAQETRRDETRLD